MPKKKTNTTPKLTKVDEADQKDLLCSVMYDFDNARGYIRDNYQDVWDKCFKLYNGKRVTRGYNGEADDFVPETFTIIESIKSSIAGGRPKFKYLPTMEKQEKECGVLNNLIEYYWSLNSMTKKILDWVGDMLVYGNGILMVSWENEAPLIQHIPLSDFFVDPTATHMNRPEEPGYPRYAGYRFLTSIKDLQEAKTIDVDTGEIIPKYKNLDSINLEGGDTEDADNMDKDRKEEYIGSVLGRDSYDDEVEVIVYFTQRRKIMIANRSVIIFDEDTPFRKDEEKVPFTMNLNGNIIEGKKTVPEIKGFLPFAILRDYTDGSLFFGKGDVEVISSVQESLNDTSSQKRDNLAYALNNMWQLDPKYRYLADQIESAPGAILPVPRNAISALDKQDMSSAADLEIARRRQEMRAATAADAAVQGTAQKFSRTTATEINAQMSQAASRFSTKLQTLEDEGFAQLARIMFKMAQIFVTNPIAVRSIGKDGVEWKTYDPDTYAGEYEPRVTLESVARAEQAAQAQGLQMIMQFAMNNPLVNQEELLRQAFKAMLTVSDDDINKLLTPPQGPIMGPDGQAMDASLVQGNALVTPQAAAAIRGEIPTDQSKFAGTARGKATQTGSQGGGGAASAINNLPRISQSQPSSAIATKKPGTK